MAKITYSERETRLIVAWMVITFGIAYLIQWSVDRMGYTRPQLIIDLLFPMMLLATGAYILKKRIPGN